MAIVIFLIAHVVKQIRKRLGVSCKPRFRSGLFLLRRKSYIVFMEPLDRLKAIAANELENAIVRDLEAVAIYNEERRLAESEKNLSDLQQIGGFFARVQNKDKEGKDKPDNTNA